MNIRLKLLLLSSSLALSIFTTTPAMADDFNKRTELQFSEPVQIPGHLLAPGKYVFQLLDNDSDPNTVQVFSMDSDGHESLVATFFAIPDYASNTPDKTVIHFEERKSGTPEAIHSWFYPGDNTGWEFVYPKEQNLTAIAMPASAPVAAVAAPTMPSAPAVQSAQQRDPIPHVVAAKDGQVEEQILIAQNEAPGQPPVAGTEVQAGSTQALPQTAGNSGLGLMTGLAMLGSGLAALFASRRKSVA